MCSDFPSPIRSDKNRIYQVLFNLLIKANQLTTNGKITVHCQHEIDFVKISVENEGFGIKVDSRDKLIHPFDLFEGEEVLGPSPSGTDLSLSICHRMLSSIGCSI